MKTLTAALCTLALAAGTAVAAKAQEALLETWRGGAEACLRAAGEDLGALAACDGVLSDACMNGEPGGMSNQGMAQCVWAESLFWDEKLNSEYKRTMAAAGRADDAERELSPEYAVRKDRLRDAQRAWIAFRDAQCAYDTAVWGAGSMRLLWAAGCVETMTRERTIALVGMRADLP